MPAHWRRRARRGQVERGVDRQEAEDRDIRLALRERPADAAEEEPERLLVDVAEGAAVDDRERVDARRVHDAVAGADGQLEVLDPGDEHGSRSRRFLEDDDVRPDDLRIGAERSLEEVRVDRDVVALEAQPRLPNRGEPRGVADDADAARPRCRCWLRRRSLTPSWLPQAGSTREDDSLRTRSPGRRPGLLGQTEMTDSSGHPRLAARARARATSSPRSSHG